MQKWPNPANKSILKLLRLLSEIFFYTMIIIVILSLLFSAWLLYDLIAAPQQWVISHYFSWYENKSLFFKTLCIIILNSATLLMFFVSTQLYLLFTIKKEENLFITANVEKKVFYIWLLLITCILSFYFVYQDFFDPQNLKQFFSDNIYISLTIYFILGALRGFTLLPSTPMVLAWALVLPLLPLFIVNLLCVFTSSTIVYYWGKYLWFDKYFNKKYPTQIAKLKSALNWKEIPVITIWWFFPLVPTDLICYTSEIMRIKLRKVLVWVAIGEWIITAIYIFWSSEIIEIFG